MSKHKIYFKSWFYNFINAPFLWSRWTDIQTFTYSGNAYLLQGKVNKMTNAKKFKIVTTGSFPFTTANIGSLAMPVLGSCGLIDKDVKYNIETPKEPVACQTTITK